MGNILEACARRGVGRLVGIGSQAEYGVHNVRIDETAVPRPETLYGVCKLAAGLSGKEFAVRHSLCYAWLRLFSTFGPGDYTDYVLPYAIESLLKGQRPRLSPCQQKWDYLYVEDIPKLIWKVVAAAGPFCDVFNLASGAPVRLKDAILTVREIIATPVEPDFGAHPGAKGGLVHLEGDPGKFIRTFGWITLTPLREALGNTVAWFRARLGEPSRGAGE
jgi:nucleoside-diphosphate-sugar epimerase